MSAYGPALFVSRRDGAELPEPEQHSVLELVRAATAAVRLRDERGEPAAPRVYDYDEYETGALGVLLYSGYAYGGLPEQIQRDRDASWAAETGRVAAEAERRFPGVYAYVGYGVED
jgi:hypothetical protein